MSAFELIKYVTTRDTSKTAMPTPSVSICETRRGRFDSLHINKAALLEAAGGVCDDYISQLIKHSTSTLDSIRYL